MSNGSFQLIWLDIHVVLGGWQGARNRTHCVWDNPRVLHVKALYLVMWVTSEFICPPCISPLFQGWSMSPKQHSKDPGELPGSPWLCLRVLRAVSHGDQRGLCFWEWQHTSACASSSVLISLAPPCNSWLLTIWDKDYSDNQMMDIEK